MPLFLLRIAPSLLLYFFWRRFAPSLVVYLFGGASRNYDLYGFVFAALRAILTSLLFKRWFAPSLLVNLFFRGVSRHLHQYALSYSSSGFVLVISYSGLSPSCVAVRSPGTITCVKTAVPEACKVAKTLGKQMYVGEVCMAWSLVPDSCKTLRPKRRVPWSA